MGIIQAKEALNMSLDERMATFEFLYNDEGPHLNARIMERLKPEVEFRLSPELPSDDASASPQLQDSTSAGKKSQDPNMKPQAGEWQNGRLDTTLSEQMLQLQVWNISTAHNWQKTCYLWKNRFVFCFF